MTDRHQLPGDISISPFPYGYVVGRLLGEATPEKLWQFIAAHRTRGAAINTACKTAKGHNVWLCLASGTFERVDCAELVPGRRRATNPSPTSGRDVL